MNDRSKNKFLFAVLLSILFMGLLGYSSYHILQESHYVEARHARIDYLRGEILRLDEVLTMSARLGAATGDPQWEERYRSNDPKLENTLVELLELLPDSIDQSFAGATNVANKALVAMEMQSFELTHQGHGDQALALLHSAAYNKQKSIYAKGMSDLNNSIEGAKKEENADMRQTMIRTFFIAGLVLVIILVSWMRATRALFQWTSTLLKQKDDLDQEIRVKSEQLMTTSKLSLLGEMTAGLGHEINNALSVITFAVTAIQKRMEKGNAAPIQRDIDRIVKMTERMEKIVKSMRSFARADHADPLEACSLNEIIDDVLELSRRKLEKQQVTLHYEKSADFELLARPVEISQVILNLVNNAADAVATMEDPWVRLSTKQSDDSIIVTVTDSGEGISKDLVDQIMTPFFTTKPRGKGTGLGLSISQNIAKGHGGSLSIDHTAPHTTFVLCLPTLASASISRSSPDAA